MDSNNFSPVPDAHNPRTTNSSQDTYELPSIPPPLCADKTDSPYSKEVYSRVTKTRCISNSSSSNCGSNSREAAHKQHLTAEIERLKSKLELKDTQLRQLKHEHRLIVSREHGWKELVKELKAKVAQAHRQAQKSGAAVEDYVAERFAEMMKSVKREVADVVQGCLKEYEDMDEAIWEKLTGEKNAA